MIVARHRYDSIETFGFPHATLFSGARGLVICDEPNEVFEALLPTAEKLDHPFGTQRHTVLTHRARLLSLIWKHLWCEEILGWQRRAKLPTFTGLASLLFSRHSVKSS